MARAEGGPSGAGAGAGVLSAIGPVGFVVLWNAGVFHGSTAGDCRCAGEGQDDKGGLIHTEETVEAKTCTVIVPGQPLRST